MLRKSLTYTFTLLLVASIFSAISVPSQAQGLGIAAGANFDNFSDIEATNGHATFDNATGFHVGAFYDLAFGPLSVRPGLVYVDVGDITVDGGSLSGSRDFDLNLLELPVDLRYRLATPLLSPYLLAGPVFRLASTDDDEFEDSLNNFSVAGGVGAGLEIALPGTGLRLYPELRYQFGVTRFGEGFEFLGTEFTTEGDTNLDAVMLRLGVSF